MTDIFISYSRVDVERAEAIAKALEAHGWRVWWDLHSLRTGQSFSKAIQQALGQAAGVIVLWSRTSIESRWVEAEASWAWEHDKLVSVLLDEALRPPFPYHNLLAQDLSGWSGDRKAPAFRKLADDLTVMIGPPPSSVPAQTIVIEAPPQPAADQHITATVPGLPEPEMVRIRPGSFLMGSPDGEGISYEYPQHEVRIARPYAIGRYPVTFDEYDAFTQVTERIQPKDQGWGRGRRPAINVSWQDAIAYTQWLSEKTGKRYRLPTEAEWEYAARAGTDSPWSFGYDETAFVKYAWLLGNSDAQTEPVGEKRPNPWGLYDVHGNVWEWVADCWHADYKEAPEDGSAWLEANGGDCAQRVIRGSVLCDRPWDLRSAHRSWFNTESWNSGIGFRLAQDL